MNELGEILKNATKSLSGKVMVLRGDFDRDGLLATLRDSSLVVMPSSDGNISIVQESGDSSDFSRQSGYFDLHKDGLYHRTPPHFVLLYCEDAGRGDSPTVVADTRPVVEEIDRRPELHVLKEVEM